MNSKLIHAGVGLLTAGVVGIIFAVAMEMATGEVVYFLVMKVTAMLFGIGGGLIGLGALRHRK